MKPTLRSLVIISTLALTGLVEASNLVIDSVVLETVGSTAVVSGGGSTDNTTTWSTGLVGQFIMFDSISNSYVAMNVTATSPTGALAAGTDSLMVARTVNSQGLTDPGTLSVYVSPIPDNTWSLTLGFEFFAVTGSPGSFTITSTPQSVGLQLTSLDIDFSQKYYTSNSSFASNILYSPSAISNLGTDTSATGGTGYTGFTATGDASFSNPAYAVSSKGTGSSYTVQLAHNKEALYMFEFRDPSSIVPEPSSALLIGVGAVALVGFVRRVRKAC